MKVNESLAKKNDNKVFKHIYFIPNIICNEFSYHEEYYLVKDGKVFLIQESERGKNDFLYPTPDTLVETCGRGIPCGEFNEKKKYPRIVKFFNVKNFKKQMKNFLQ